MNGRAVSSGLRLWVATRAGNRLAAVRSAAEGLGDHPHVELVDPLVGREALLRHAEPVAASTVEVGLDRTPGRPPRGVGLDRPVEEGIVGGGGDEERWGVVGNGPGATGPVDRSRERGPDVSVVVRGEIEDQTRARREADGADAVGLRRATPPLERVRVRVRRCRRRAGSARTRPSAGGGRRGRTGPPPP